MTISSIELDALFELAARAPKSLAEGQWLQALARRMVEEDASPPVEEDASPPVED